MMGHRVGQRILSSCHIARSLLTLALDRLLVWQAKLLDTSHVHFELALVREEVLAVAGSTIALVGAT
jgi:hypothetical protein